jgi:uncharacterized ion transporter superfamily protein YfcC
MFKKIPHTYVIVFYTIMAVAILTWIVPGGKYVEETIVVDGVEQTQMVFKQLENEKQTWQIFSAIFDGFVKQSDIIIFILMIGGAFWIMNSSKAIDIGILSFLKFAKRLEKFSFFRRLGVNNIILTLVMLVFSIFGAVFGMSEETIAFIIILVPLAISMGYDSIVGVAIGFVAAGLGFAGAILNPFTIGIAQGLAELPLFSGIEYRMVCWLIINAIGIVYILRYANKVHRNPTSSLVYDDDKYWRDRAAKNDLDSIKYETPKAAWASFLIVSIGLVIFSIFFPESNLKIGNTTHSLNIIPILTGIFVISSFFALRKATQFYILNLLAFTIAFLIVGVMGYEWYVKEIATLFFAMGIFSGIAMDYSPNTITKHFLEGVKDILSAALIVGLAAGIIVIMEDGKIIDSVLYSLSQSMEGMNKISNLGVMYGIQNLINIFIPSGSAKAAITMPIMAPFSDLIGVSRQATVMAFQFGDGFTNMLTPTSGVLIGVLGVAKIPYEKWVRWAWPLITI